MPIDPQARLTGKPENFENNSLFQTADLFLRVTHVAEVGEKIGAGGIPSEICARPRTGRTSVPPGEEPEESELLLGLFR